MQGQEFREAVQFAPRNYAHSEKVKDQIKVFYRFKAREKTWQTRL